MKAGMAVIGVIGGGGAEGRGLALAPRVPVIPG
jgi:hypothetical protein